MKQSVDLMKSRTEMNSMTATKTIAENALEKTRVNSNHVLSYLKSRFELTHLFLGVNSPAGLTRRAMTLLLVLVMSVGSAWGEEVALTWESAKDNGCYWFQSSLFSDVTTETILRIYDKGHVATKMYVATYDGWNVIFDCGDHPSDDYYNTDKGCYELTFNSSSAVEAIKTKGLRIKAENGGTHDVDHVTLETPTAAVDEFLSTATPTTDTGDSYELPSRSETSYTLSMTKPLTYVASPKYARFQVLKNGSAVDPSSILSITSTGSEAVTTCTTAKNGKYVYNTGGLGTLTVKLENITASEFTQYQVVCFLSDDTGTEAAGVLTKEPDPDLKYTYSFTFPPFQAETRLLPEVIPVTALDDASIEIKIFNEITKDFGTDAAAFMDKWYIKWYLVNTMGTKQAFEMNWGAKDDVWAHENQGWTNTNNESFYSYIQQNNSWWYVEGNVGHIKLYAPKNHNFGEYVGYRLVCEVSDDYDGMSAEPKVIYYIPIPSPITFEYDGTPANTDVTQTLDSRTSTTSVTLDWTNTKTSATVTTAGYKYARFYVVDGTGTAVSPTDEAHQLTVSGGTLCTTAESGYYYYTGSDITLPTVTLSSTGDVRDYKVVCWLATTETNIANEGTTVSEEPDIDVAYTFSFKKPSVTTTVSKAVNIAWSGASMTADATDGAPTDWDTSWADLAKAQYVKWYVVAADGTTKQPLEIGTSRQNDKWTIGLSGTPFAVSDNVAVLTGQTTFGATEWTTWGKPAIYAPANVGYADVHDYKVVCEVSEEASASATPNVRYTFSFTKDFLGSDKSTISETSKREVLATATEVSCTLSEVVIPSGTKYARIYLTDASDNVVNPSGLLAVSGGTAVTATGYENYGFFVYNESGIASAPTVTLTLSTAELNLYKVVMVTSADRAVQKAGVVTSEPDYDTRKTWTFKYPTRHDTSSATMEWSAKSMTVPVVDIEALKGTGYLNDVKSNYYIKWTVVDGSDVQQSLASGSSRQNDTWTFNGTPYTVSSNAATVSNNSSLSAENWNSTWGVPKLYAPKNKTYDELKDCKVVCQLYESSTEDAPSLAMTYTVTLTHTEFVGELKDGGSESSEMVENVDEDATSVNVPLGNALTAFGSTAKYAHIWLERNGTAVDPTGKLALVGTAFTQDAKYGYYLADAGGVSLSTVSLTADAGTFNQYTVYVALSADMPASTTGYAPRRAGSPEPDYDYLYSIGFGYAPKGKVINRYLKADAVTSKSIEISQSEFLSNLGKSALAELNDNFYMKWYVLDDNGDPIDIWCKGYYGANSEKINFVFTSSDNDGYPFKVTDKSLYLFPEQMTAKGKTFAAAFTDHKLNNPVVWAQQSHSFSEYVGYQIVCVTSAVKPTIDGSNNVTAEPDENSLVTYIFNITASGKDPFIGEEKSSIVSATEVAEIANASVTSKSGIDLRDNKKVKTLTDGGFVPKYVRWYVLDSSDNLVDGVLTTETASTKVAGVGEYIYNSTGTTDLLKGLSIDVSGQADTDLTHYRIVGLLSDCSADDNLVVNGTQVKEEPDFDLKVTVTFETAFRGQLTDDAVEREIVFTQLASKWDRTVSGQEEFMVSISESGTVKLQSKTGATILEQPLNILADLSTATRTTVASLASLPNLYVRWYLERKDGSSAVVPGAIRKHDSSNVHFLPSNSAGVASLKHGFYWYKQGSNYSYSSGNTPNQSIMMKFVQKGEYLPADGINITDYNLVLNVSTHEIPAGYLTGVSNDPMTHEPDKLDLRYVFNFQNHDFPADNIETVKTIYKDAFYDKSTGKITPVLFNNIVEVMADLGTNYTTFAANSYARWYVTDKSGNIVADIDDWTLARSGDGASYTKRTGYGYYADPVAIGSIDAYNKSHYDPVITLPSGYDLNSAYKDYNVVCVITTNTEGKSLPATEPAEMQVKYVFNLICTEDDYAALPFVHYQGVSGRDWIAPEGSTGSQAQKVWNSGTGQAEDYNGDIRQGVHTWEYEVYIKPGETRRLILPIQNYGDVSHDDALEPRGYFRWYDWKTDKAVVNGNFTFAAASGSLLKDIDGRGLFALALPKDVHPCHDNVGVTFTPTASFTESIDIACDVSKYSDGITTVSGNSYLVHEPTLSNRYIFHIHPASESYSQLMASKQTLEEGENAIKAGADDAQMHSLFTAYERTMFNLMENKGKVVVSLKAEKGGSFALRLDEHRLQNYILKDGSDYVSADLVKWYAYFENDGGIWRKKLNIADGANRIETFTWSNFAGEYSNLKGTSTTTISDGKKFHVVGFVGNGNFNPETGTGNYAPVVHYELHFIEAPAIALTDLSTTDITRTEEYMRYHYDLAGVVDFDGNPLTMDDASGHEAEYYSTENWYDAPTSSADNMTYMPFPWDNIQYGFCYPQLTHTVKFGMGKQYVSPEHGDYIILKSMNVDGISNDDSNATAPYTYDWWNSSTLYDYTHTAKDAAQYGSFLYTDASDESRTIATIPFTADLCHGSSIYFTAVVADMTSGATKPQLLIRIVGLNSSGERVRVVAFHTCDISSTGASTGQWYQIYGQSTIPNDFDDTITRFVAEVINYASNTDGADFAIDQLMVYTNTSKVMLAQSGNTTCEDPTNGKLKVYMDAEGLQNVFGKSDTEKTIYWRICREDDGTVVTAPGMYPQYDAGGTKLTDDGSFTYGMSKVKSNFNPADDPTGDVKTETARESDAYGWYKAADNTIYFQIAFQNFPGLEEGGRYYVSVFNPNESFDESKDSYWGGLHWGATSKCSIFSSFFVPRRQYVTYTTNAVGGTEGGAISVACGSAATVSDVQMILKVPNLNEATGFQSFKDLHYDYVFVPLTKWKSTTETFSHGGTDYKYEDLKTALATYRGASSTYKTYGYNDTDKGLASGFASVDATKYNLLSYAIEEGVLKLAYSTTFSHTFSGSDFTVTCLPVEQSVTVNSTATTVCSPFEVTFNLEGSSPELALGFSDVVYPVTGYEKRVLRIGLEQLNNLRNNGYKLHIPINNFRDKDKKTANAVNFDGDYFTLSAASSDGVNTTTGKKFAKIVNPDDNSATPFVDADHMYLELDLSGSNCEIETFYEGFEYEVSATYFDSRDAGDPSGRCEGDVYMLIKVVPEFVTWEPQLIETVGGVDYYNVNWNNDANWHRSTRAELYKDENVTGKTQNTATYGHPNGYDNNGEHSLASISSSAKNAFIPMRFSYVTLPSDLRAPSLVNMDIRAYAHSMKAHLGGTIQAGDMGTDRSPKDGGTSNATTYLRYDMLVRYPLVAGDDQDLCQGHLKADGTTVVGDGTAKTYDCEKFIGNSCREIYFKPRAEIINQQRLVDYQKAWVEKEVDRNKWYLMSAPLKGTYAGDMFVPATAITDYSLATPATVTGRQVTEAFQPITFPDDVTSTIYSRSNYPVYQRSWDHSEQGGKVYTETTDPRATDYTANLKYNGAVASTFAQWTHVFNDMSVKYNDLQGFALRAHKKDGAVGEKALFRWPKTNESYTYYNYADSKGTITATTTKAATDNARFVTDGYDDKATMTDIPLDEANVNTDNQYYLVGNPYMSSIDMAKFFEKNTTLTGGYWKVDGNPTASLTTGQIKPMEAFFVKTADATTKIQFDNSMMIDGNAPVISAPAPAQRTQGLTLTAENENGRSEASVEIADEVKTVETLFDSNLEDVPMVYTVADGKAVSVNQLTALETLCFGVTCKGDEAVEVTLTGLDTMEGNLYVVDAVEGTSTAVAEGDAVEVMPNEYGRYFLTRSAMLGEMKDEAVNGFVVSVHGGMVTVSGAEALGRVRALSVSGAVMYDAVSSDTSIAFPLQQGTYVIEADGRKAVKILVK